MSKKFFVSVIFMTLSINLFCKPSGDLWLKGDNAYLRSIINMIDAELFGNKLSKHIRVVNWFSNDDTKAASTYYNAGDFDGSAFCWVGVNDKVIDPNNFDFEAVYCVLLHEMCHVATYMIDGVLHDEKSVEFKRWIDYAQKESKIARNYDISWFNVNAYRGAVK